MKQLNHVTSLIALVLCLMVFLTQAQDKSEKATINIDLAYHQLNNELPVIKVSAKTRREKKFQPVEGVEVNLFFNAESSQGFMGRVRTNLYGMGSIAMPTRFKDQWDSLSHFTFIGTVVQNDSFDDQSTELEIMKAKIELDLEDIDSVHTIHTKVVALQDTGWTPQPETEIKLVIRRLMSDLPATEEESYTTDENGEVSAEYSMIIPGDAQGDIVIGSKIDGHDMYGSLVTTKTVKWGQPLVSDSSFGKRTLWAPGDKVPLSLLILALSIVVVVWGIIFYLFYMITRIAKLGKAKDPA